MSISNEITALSRLNQELDDVEQSATKGLNLARNRLSRFPNNTILIQLFAYLNNSLLFVETLRRRIEYSKIILANDTASDELFQDIGQDLAEQLGRILKAKVGVIGVTNRLENW